MSLAIRGGERTVRLGRRRGTDILAAVAGGVLLLVVLAAILAPWLAPHDPESVDLGAAYAGMSADHPLGTDASGRDLLSRLLYGARLSLLGPALVICFSTVLGVAMAVVAAWKGGWIDALLSRTTEVIYAFPGLILAVLSSAVFGPGLIAPVIALSIAFTPIIARVIRSVALRERNLPYIAALQVQGQSSWRICWRHLLPNIGPFLLVQAGVGYAYALLDLAAISFLGLGVQPPAPDWGVMITEGQASILDGFPQESLFAAGAVLITIVSINLLTSWLAERFDVEEVR